jgi:glycerol uptake facilitator-like aquaporin
VFEVIGTFILAFGIVCCQYVPPLKDKIPNPFHDIFISLSLYLAIVIGAPFSGGHFNPAVTFGVYFLKDAKMTNGKLSTYLIAQFIGAIIGVTLAKIFFDC